MFATYDEINYSNDLSTHEITLVSPSSLIQASLAPATSLDDSKQTGGTHIDPDGFCR